MTKILVIPDTQVKADVPLDHLDWIAQYAVDKKPDVIVHIGDFADMPSLSSYDVGKKDFEGRRYTKDVDATHEALDRLITPIDRESNRVHRNKKKQWAPRKVLTLGNHENRINRAINNDPKLEGLISVDDLEYGMYGFEVIPYLQPIVIEGVAFCHYFPSGVMQRPPSTANAMLNRQHISCVAGHQQGLQIATGKRADGALLTSVIAGSFYLHDEEYMGVFGNKHWRGALMLHNVKDGEFDLNPLPMSYLRKKYG